MQVNSAVLKEVGILETEWRDRDEIIHAVKKQEKIRKHLTQRLKGKEGTKIIRKIRDLRCRS